MVRTFLFVAHLSRLTIADVRQHIAERVSRWWNSRYANVSSVSEPVTVFVVMAGMSGENRVIARFVFHDSGVVDGSAVDAPPEEFDELLRRVVDHIGRREFNGPNIHDALLRLFPVSPYALAAGHPCAVSTADCS